MRAAELLLTERPMPTAIVCYNDLTAVGALRAIRAADLRVPDDISVVVTFRGRTGVMWSSQPASAVFFAVHADGANSDYSPVDGAADVTLAWHRDFEGSVRVGALEWTINLGPTIEAMLDEEVASLVADHTAADHHTEWNLDGLRAQLIGHAA